MDQLKIRAWIIVTKIDGEAIDGVGGLEGTRGLRTALNYMAKDTTTTQRA